MDKQLTFKARIDCSASILSLVEDAIISQTFSMRSGQYELSDNVLNLFSTTGGPTGCHSGSNIKFSIVADESDTALTGTMFNLENLKLTVDMNDQSFIDVLNTKGGCTLYSSDNWC